ncbi:DUF4189 domain-containing protein [Nocardia sp. NPDC052566]|uniref:DUF4189 domain-containing protein n=1 Tax=Nocardia sp. NPDC052566 TaxID=3364330 RepID=UPI0037C7AEB6
MSISRWAAVAFAAMSATASTMAAAGTAHAGGGDRYGAIAISFETGELGYAVNLSTAAEVERIAIEQCGRVDCGVYVNFVNACGAVAVAPDGSLAWTWGVNRADTGRSAVDLLGLRAPKFPNPGSATPGAARVELAVCTVEGGSSTPSGSAVART